MSWYDAIEFCNLLSKKVGLRPYYKVEGREVSIIKSANGYSLPSEAEWEYAARGGSESKDYIYSGSDYLGRVGWYDKNSRDETHSVGQKQPNELGIYDMSGNVWEWCHDRYDSAYYASSPRSNPQGPESGKGERVLRGGSWQLPASETRVANRYWFNPVFTRSGGSIGFSVVRDL